MQVPCGKCLACLSNKRAEWVFRLEQEHRYSSSSYFITLTYDEKHLRTNRSLCKRDLQLYLKRLRKNDNNQRIRYYAVGEYGEKSGRPHYHLLLFNVKLENSIRSSWCDIHGKTIGIVHVGRVSQASIAYCTKYVIQKAEHVPSELEPPFATMSRAYGIGGRYLSDRMVDWHRGADANYAVSMGRKVRLSRFYKSKIWYDEHEREKISKQALMQRLAEEQKQEAFWLKKYGPNWKAKYLEMRDGMVSRIQTTVAYTQSI